MISPAITREAQAAHRTLGSPYLISTSKFAYFGATMNISGLSYGALLRKAWRLRRHNSLPTMPTPRSSWLRYCAGAHRHTSHEATLNSKAVTRWQGLGLTMVVMLWIFATPCRVVVSGRLQVGWRNNQGLVSVVVVYSWCFFSTSCSVVDDRLTSDKRSSIARRGIETRRCKGPG